jgi:glycosyltransferase involved in cell wall biosynthesis
MEAGYTPRSDAERGVRPLLLDVTRLVALRWTGRLENGIDRVCLAYLRRYRSAALAVIQHRGVIRVLDHRASQNLFDLLEYFGETARRSLVSLIAGALASASRPAFGSAYLNVSHTDYDLVAHARWVQRHALKPVYLVHDLIPITHAEHCRPRAVRRHRSRVIGALRHGSGIIVTTKAVEHDLRRFASQSGLPVPPVAVAAIAGASLMPTTASAADERGYFLCIGTIESRKNHRLLVDVWQRLRGRLGSATPRLVIVGKWGTGVADLRRGLEASGMLGGLVDVVERCDDGELARLMSGARAVLMPTLAEGFGLPMAEALALGVPVMASDLPCFHEVGQGIPWLLDPHDADAWEERLVSFDAAAARRQRQIVRLHGYRPLTWGRHFSSVDAWLAGTIGVPVPAVPYLPDGSTHPFADPASVLNPFHSL